MYARQVRIDAERKCKLVCLNKGARNADNRKAAKGAVAEAKANVRDCQKCAADARADLAQTPDSALETLSRMWRENSAREPRAGTQ